MRGHKSSYEQNAKLSEKRGIFAAIVNAEHQLSRPILVATRLSKVDPEWEPILNKLERCKEELEEVRKQSEELTLTQTGLARLYKR